MEPLREPSLSLLGLVKESWGLGACHNLVDFQIQIFLSKKCQRSTRLKRNPRDVPWTVLYRRKHKKGVHAEEGAQKRRVKRAGAQATSRPIAGVTVEQLLEKRNQKPEFRRAQREQAVKAAKDAVRAKKTEQKKDKLKVMERGWGRNQLSNAHNSLFRSRPRRK